MPSPPSGEVVLASVLVRLDRLEMVAGVLATLAARQAVLDKGMLDVLQVYAASVTAERKQRDVAAHLPEPEL